MTPHYLEQIGDYVIELMHPRDFWRVRMAGAEEHLSSHNTKGEAKVAIRRYQAVRSVHVSKAQMAELFNLYHLARTALSGQDDSPYQRMLWAAKEFARANPAISETRAYKELSNARENAAYQGF